jgi:CysZ protein
LPERPLAPQRPTLLDGPRSLYRGARFIATRRATWTIAAVPAAIVLLLTGVLIWLSFDRFGPWLSRALLPEVSTWYGQGAKELLRWLGSAVAAYCSFWLALFVAPSLSAPALEHLVRLQETELEVPERPPSSFWFELRAGLEAQLVALALLGPAWLGVWLISLLLPALGVLLLPIQALLVALALAWNLVDYPLTLRGIRARSRLALLRRHLGPVLGFGLSFAVVSWIPFAGLLLLPAGVVGATRLIWLILPDERQPQGALSPRRPKGL